jgi:uncharacterized protein DUF2027
MRFKVGDKVKFIDEMGGGVVTGVIDTKLVKVKTDDGFEMPVLSVELIPDHRSMPQEDFVVKTSHSAIPKEEPEEPDFISEINPWGNVKEEKGVYIAFEPHEQQWLLTGDIDVVIANNTSYDILYSLFLNREGVIEGVDFSSVPSNSKIVIETIGRDELANWLSGYLQVLLHSDSPKKVYMPVHSVIDIKIGRFFKEGSYKSNSLLNGKAIIITVATLSALGVATDNVSARKSDPEISSGKAKAITEKQLIDEYRTSQSEAEVDLHIGELVDNILGMSSLDMINIQINTFKKVLDNAIANDYKKITFIHGVGNGVLKSAIIKELNEYEGLENSMASIAKFGVGAIDIRITARE